MKRQTAIASLPSFPPNYGWLTQHSHSFTPRSLSQETQRAMCETLLRGDKDFLHLLRQCKTSWYIAIVLGADTVHVHVYEPAVVHDPDKSSMSQPSIMEHAQFFQVDRTTCFQPLNEDQIQEVLYTHAMLYSTRCLKPVEIKMLESIETAIIISSESQRPLLSGLAKPYNDGFAHGEVANVDNVGDDDIVVFPPTFLSRVTGLCSSNN